MEWHTAKDLLSRVRLILAVATEIEARPVVEGLQAVHRVEMATKPLWLGDSCTDTGPVPYALVVTGYDKVNAAHALTMVLEASLPQLVIQVGVGGAFATSGLQPGDVALATRDSYGDTGVLAPEGWFSSRILEMPLARVRGRELWNTFELDPELVARATRAVEAVDWAAPGAQDAGAAAPRGDGSGGPEPGVGGVDGAPAAPPIAGRPPRVATGPFVTLSQVTGKKEEGDALAERWGAVVESMEGAAAAHVCALYEVPFLEIRGVSNLVADRDRSTWQVGRAALAAARAALEVVARVEYVAGGAAPPVEAGPRPSEESEELGAGADPGGPW